MTQNRFYSSLTKQTTTTADPGTSGTTLTVVDSTSFASLDSSFPWTALISWGAADQEIVTVTARPSSTTLTVTRGQDGSTGRAHTIGATVDHGVSARDFNEAGAHIGASTGVHGVTGALVGTSDTQTLANKTLASPTVSGDLPVSGNLDAAGNALGVANPNNHGLVAWAFDPALSGSSTALGAGIMNLSAVYVQRSVTTTKIFWGVGTAGTVTAGQNFVGLYNAAGTRLVSVGVDATAATVGIQTTTIPSTALTPGMYWIAFLFNGTPPALYRGTANSPALGNVGQGAAQLRFAILSGTKTSLPTSITPSSNTASPTTYWAGIG